MKHFCVMPWYSREVNFATGKETVCCWLKNNPDRKQLQDKFLAGEKPLECEKCWTAEDRGSESRRQMENRFLDFKIDRDISLIEQDVETSTVRTNLYQVFLGSTCNSTCATCGPGSSSLWRSLLANTISIRQENLQVDRYFEQFADSIDWGEAKRFNLLGGEPLLIKRSFDILQKLLNADNTDCRISFVTNGSVVLSAQQIETIKHFSDINCCVSIDGTGKTFEYIRYPLSWQTMLHNLEQYRQAFNEVNVSFTVSNLNCHERSDIIRWFREHGLLYIENYVVSPAWFEYLVNPAHPLWTKFVQEIARQDQLKGIKIQDYIPYVADLIDKSLTIEQQEKQT